jgi:hypothetical protein
LLRSLSSYLSGLAFHVWRAMRGRPQYVHLADTRRTLVTFGVVLGVSSLAYSLVQNPGIAGVLMGLLRWACASVLLLGLFFRNNQSLVPLACAFGSLAGFTLLSALSLLVLGSANPARDVVQVVLLALSVVSMLRIKTSFSALPLPIRQRGYLPDDYQGDSP